MILTLLLVENLVNFNDFSNLACRIHISCQEIWILANLLMTAFGLTQTLKNNSPVNGTDDREARSKFWIAIYTRPRSEKKVAKRLSNLCIENYVPTQIKVSQWSDRKKKIETVIIPSLVFAKIDQSQMLDIKKLPLTVRILSKPGESNVAIIPEKDIDKLKFILGQTEIPVSYDGNNFVEQDSVRIIRGPLMGMTGKIIKNVDDKSEILIGIDFLGGARVKIDKINLEVLK